MARIAVLAALFLMAIGCGGTAGPQPTVVRESDYTGTVDAVSAADGFVFLMSQGQCPCTDVHVTPSTVVSGVASLQALEALVLGGAQVTAHAHFLGDYTSTGGEGVTSLQVTNSGQPLRWHWRAVISPTMPWHGWYLFNEGRLLFWLSPSTAFTADSQFTSFADVVNVGGWVCADMETFQTIAQGTEYRVTTINAWRPASGADCGTLGGTPPDPYPSLSGTP